MKKWIFVFIAAILIVSTAIIITNFKLEEIEITGCENVDEQEIRNAISNLKFADNTLGIYLSTKMNPIEDIPFVAKLDFDFASKNKIVVTVYEKSIAGCVEYMNSFVYFDKDGIILESSGERIEGVPCIEGLTFNQWEMGEQLPIEDTGKFNSILAVTQLIEKYELNIDGIRFTNENEIVLYYNDITILLGDGKNLSIQIMNLGSILEQFEGMSDTLYMKDFDSDTSTASFKKN